MTADTATIDGKSGSPSGQRLRRILRRWPECAAVAGVIVLCLWRGLDYPIAHWTEWEAGQPALARFWSILSLGFQLISVSCLGIAIRQKKVVSHVYWAANALIFSGIQAIHDSLPNGGGVFAYPVLVVSNSLLLVITLLFMVSRISYALAKSQHKPTPL